MVLKALVLAEEYETDPAKSFKLLEPVCNSIHHPKPALKEAEFRYVSGQVDGRRPIFKYDADSVATLHSRWKSARSSDLHTRVVTILTCGPSRIHLTTKTT